MVQTLPDGIGVEEVTAVSVVQRTRCAYATCISQVAPTAFGSVANKRVTQNLSGYPGTVAQLSTL